jgi:predicted nucleic acid-binding protein
MYIPHLHQIVEVKSVFTYNQKKDHNEAKFAQVVKDGYALLIMVYDRGGKRKVQDELR